MEGGTESGVACVASPYREAKSKLKESQIEAEQKLNSSWKQAKQLQADTNLKSPTVLCGFCLIFFSALFSFFQLSLSREPRGAPCPDPTRDSAPPLHPHSGVARAMKKLPVFNSG